MVCTGSPLPCSLPSNALCPNDLPPYRLCPTATNTITSVRSSLDSSSSSTTLEQTNVQDQFRYSRASPSVRWPHLKFEGTTTTNKSRTGAPSLLVEEPGSDYSTIDSGSAGLEQSSQNVEREAAKTGGSDAVNEIGGSVESQNEKDEVLPSRSRTKIKKMNKLALKRAKDWMQRVQFVTDEILNLRPDEFVADVLDRRKVQMSPTDYCFVVKWVGKSNWQRALEIYEWLNLKHWYTPSPRMLATILAVLGKANQEALAEEIFERVEPGIGNVVQVYNSMMGVHARHGRFGKVQELFDLMRSRGCEPDLVSFNTLINARAKSGMMPSGSALELLSDVRRSGLQPDTITYNTLISACSLGSNLEDAIKVYREMEAKGCQPDLWTYNAMISVYGRAGMAKQAELLFHELGRRGFYPDAVTFNSLLYAFARDGNAEKIDSIRKKMVEYGSKLDEISYNTLIHMHGKQGRHDLAFQLYKDMKLAGCNPDAVTYTVLIDSLGKTDQISEAADVLLEMIDSGVKPTLHTFSALICGYAKAGMREEAKRTFEQMVSYGIKPDSLAYSVVLDVILRSNDTAKALIIYQRMLRDGFRPDRNLYTFMIQMFSKENKHGDVEKMIQDLKEIHSVDPSEICTVLVNAQCYDRASEFLKIAVRQGREPDQSNLLSILNSHLSLNRHTDAEELINFLKEQAPAAYSLVREALILVHCKSHRLEAAMEEYHQLRGIGDVSVAVYECLILCCEEMESYANCSQLFSDMRFYGVEPTKESYRRVAVAYCKLGFPETAHHLIQMAEQANIHFEDFSLYVTLIESYGKLKLWQRSESVVGVLRQSSAVDRKVWNALINAYAFNGCYEQARAVFNKMMKDGPSPTVESINGLMQALINAERIDELYVIVEELQEMGFKISKSTILLMLDSFARSGNIFEVKKIYHGMKTAGYLPTMHLYRSMIGLFSKGKRVRDVEAMVAEMKEAGFKPDLSILNYTLRLYTEISDFRKTIEVYNQIRKAGYEANEDTYNTIICMYSNDLRAEEAFSLLHEMMEKGLQPKLESYKRLLWACGRQQLWDLAEDLFQDMISKGCKTDRALYHMMMKIYRKSGNHVKAENVLLLMKDANIEPTVATMHMLMDSYGMAGQPTEAENVLNSLKTSGLIIGMAPYASVIEAYLKAGDHTSGIGKLLEMKKDGLEPDYRIWTCFIRAASLSQHSSEALELLNSLQNAGFDLPVRLLTEKAETLVREVDLVLTKLQSLEAHAAFIFVNALEDLLWAFERRATASWVFQLAVSKSIYGHDVFRVAEKDWGADFRKLSPGAALVGLTLWLDHMQDASLQGSPESPKSVVLITGTAEYNRISLSKTIKAYLWEMGSPFLPCKTRTGLLIAKAHSLRMWLKDSAFCMDLELRDVSTLPELNSMQLYEGAFMRAGLVPAFREIHEGLGEVRPKKFAKLALLTDEKRDKFIAADIKGRQEKLEKKKRGGLLNLRKRHKRHGRRLVGRSMPPREEFGASAKKEAVR
ncbi:pentatricopeptide repeat-containing protein At3g18110, chloroplastic [Nymphaea colorata]|nr:pentatricopeptide repeat-containing protein At3g18110, chloroplastic [Nymphaea colorata]